MTKTYKISEISQLTGLSSATLRYYEDIKLLKPQRAENNYRVFTEDDLRWIEFIHRAKATGMTLVKIVEYSRLREMGDSTITQRISLLSEQEVVLREKIQELDDHLGFISKKKQVYFEQLEKLK
ncbi:MerR family transcriptional regulator [Lactovum odontotermitis]